MQRNTRRLLVCILSLTACAACAGMWMGGHTALTAAAWLGLGIAVYVGSTVTLPQLRLSGSSPRQRHAGIAEVYRATTEALASAIAAKDTHERHHVHRVRCICEMVAAKLGLDDHFVQGVGVAALVHDVGKLGVPESILLKPGPLDPEEFARMSNHAAVGAKILEGIPYPWNVAEMVLHHHEKYDGTGYPGHIAGDRIPLGARIIAVAEVYDGLVSDRCYKSGWSHQQAIEHIEKLSRSHFDPAVVRAMLAVQDEVALLCSRPVVEPASRLGEAGAADRCAAADIIAQANREMMSLLEIAETLSSTLELDEVLALLAQRTRRLSEAATCVVFLRDQLDPQALRARVAVGKYQESISGSIVRVGKGVTGKVASRIKPAAGHYDPNDLKIRVPDGAAVELKSYMVAPIVSYGELIGTINLYDDSSNAFTDDDLQTLISVAGRAALAIQNASAFESIRDSAMKDPVTGLYNGRFLRSQLETEINRAHRRGEPVTVLGMDLDNFKAVNDYCGHSRGDTVLRDVAGIFQHLVRDYDLVVRNGGDEFVIVLPGTPASEAMRTVERIQRRIRHYARRAISDPRIGLGVSIGVASYPEDASSAEALLARADAAMYRDKRARKLRQSAA